MATIVEYNGITLYNVMTRKWDEEVVYDSTGTDEIGKKYSFVFQGVLHQQRVPLTNAEVFVSSGDTSVDNGIVAGSLFSLLEHVRRVLNHPRGVLRILFGTSLASTLALEVGPATATQTGQITGNHDIDNGPKPRVISVVPIGSKAFRITLAIDATVGTCVGKTRTKDNMVINNRWSVSEGMDDSFFVTRRITGQLRLAAGVFNTSTSPSGVALVNGFPGHAYKHLTIPPLENGFKREGITFTSSADGLNCNYEIIDRQVHTAAPWPATKLEGTHTEATSFGTFFSSEMHVRLTGDAACDKRLLIERAIQILDQRLYLSSVAENTQGWVDNFSITDHIGEQAIIEASARINRSDQIAGSDTVTGGANPNLFWGLLGKTLYLPSLSVSGKEVANTNYNYQQSRVPWLYGYKASEAGPEHERRPAVLFFLHCYLQNPCTDVHDVGPGNPKPEEPTEYEYPREDTPPVYESENPPVAYQPTSDTFSESTKAAIYTTAEVSSEYCTKTMVVGLPIASVAPQNSPNGLLPSSLLAQSPSVATTRLIPLSGPQNYRIQRMNLERIGAEPELPTPVTFYMQGQARAALIDSKIEILAPIRSPDGSQQVNRVVATYVYQLDRTPNFADKIPIGINPITNFDGYDGQKALSFAGNMGIESQTSSRGPQTG